jgi:hypothetical protein
VAGEGVGVLAKLATDDGSMLVEPVVVVERLFKKEFPEDELGMAVNDPWSDWIVPRPLGVFDGGKDITRPVVDAGMGEAGIEAGIVFNAVALVWLATCPDAVGCDWLVGCVAKCCPSDEDDAIKMAVWVL